MLRTAAPPTPSFLPLWCCVVVVVVVVGWGARVLASSWWMGGTNTVQSLVYSPKFSAARRYCHCAIEGGEEVCERVKSRRAISEPWVRCVRGPMLKPTQVPDPQRSEPAWNLARKGIRVRVFKNRALGISDGFRVRRSSQQTWYQWQWWQRWQRWQLL
jgi:hypothetical protein